MIKVIFHWGTDWELLHNLNFTFHSMIRMKKKMIDIDLRSKKCLDWTLRYNNVIMIFLINLDMWPHRKNVHVQFGEEAKPPNGPSTFGEGWFEARWEDWIASAKHTRVLNRRSWQSEGGINCDIRQSTVHRRGSGSTVQKCRCPMHHDSASTTWNCP